MNAVEASIRVAEKHGLRVHEPVALRSTNNTVAWLRPTPVVAKIGVGRHSGFLLEVAVAAELSALGAPVVSPAHELPAVVHFEGDYQITFWRYCPQPDDVDIPDEQVAAALRQLHAHNVQLSETLKSRLPRYTSELQLISELLRDAERLSALPAHDRHFLSGLFDRLWQRLQAQSGADTHVVIHGSPHPYNVLRVEGQPRFIDFETTCVGPVEWDLAHTSPQTAAGYAGAVDPELLETCRNLVRLKTAVWCWSNVERGDLRFHAEAHLAYLKKTFAP